MTGLQENAAYFIPFDISHYSSEADVVFISTPP